MTIWAVAVNWGYSQPSEVYGPYAMKAEAEAAAKRVNDATSDISGNVYELDDPATLEVKHD